MRREDFEHVLAAAAEVSGHDELVVIGSQAILGSHSDPPATLLVSLEVDGLIDANVLLARAPDLPVAAETRDHIQKMLRSMIASKA